MCNCNQKRAMYSSEGTLSRRGMVKAMLTQKEPIVLNGNVTGRMYVFRNIRDVNWVDRRDALSMRGVIGLQLFE